MSGPPESSPGAAPGSRVPPLPNGSAPWAYPPPGGYGTGLPPYGLAAEPARRRLGLWPPARPEWLTALVAIAVLAAVGAAVAPLWVHLAPRLAFRVDQPGRALPVVPEAEEYIAADGRFVLITVIVGVTAAVGCWLVRRSRGPLVLLALAAGGLLGAVITWRLGLRIGTGYQPADLRQVGKVIYQPLTLRARSALVVEPVAAVIVYLLAVGFSARNDLGHDPATPPTYGTPTPAPTGYGDPAAPGYGDPPSAGYGDPPAPGYGDPPSAGFGDPPLAGRGGSAPTAPPAPGFGDPPSAGRGGSAPPAPPAPRLGGPPPSGHGVPRSASPVPGYGQDSPVPGYGQDSPVPGYGQDSPLSGYGQYSPAPGHGHDGAGPGHGKDGAAPAGPGHGQDGAGSAGPGERGAGQDSPAAGYPPASSGSG